MPYCTLADLQDAVTKEKLIQLTDDDSLGAVFEGRVNKAIAAADTLIDSYLRGKFTLPLASPAQGVLDRLRQLSTDFTYFYLYQRRRELEMPDDLQKQYDRNTAYLKDLAAGRVLLDTPAEVPNTGAIFKTNKDSSSRVFTSDVMAGF